MKHKPRLLHGSIIKNTTIAGFGLSETAYPGDSQISLHSHDFAYFCFVLKGSFDEIYKKTTCACRSGSLIFHPPFETHSDRFHTAARCFNLQLDDLFFERAGRFSGFGKTSAERGSGFTSRIAAKVYREFCLTDELSPLVVEGLMLELLGEFLRFADNKTKSQPPVWLNRVLELLNDCFSENLSLAEIAKTAGVHETHLAREFKKHYGCTVGEHLRRLRIEFACRELLSTSNVPVSEIALASGVADQSHFTKIFKQTMSVSPARYRKMLRGANHRQKC